MKLKYRIARWIGSTQWLRLGLRRRLVRTIAHPAKVPSAPFEATFRGGHYRGDIANAQEWHVFFFGGYELPALALIRDILSSLNGPVACDVGGNLGGHTLVMARNAAQVHTFEPYGPLADRIEEQLSLNGHRHVTVHRVGLGEEPAELSYYLDRNARNQGTGSFLADHNEGSSAAVLKVVRADDYIGDAIDRLDFMKIDIEGFEAPALAGMQETLAKTEPVIMMEITESSQKLVEEKGGYAALFPFACDFYRVENPGYRLGLFQREEYRLAPLETIEAERNSFNVLIVPHSRRAAIGGILRKAGADRAMA